MDAQKYISAHWYKVYGKIVSVNQNKWGFMVVVKKGKSVYALECGFKSPAFGRIGDLEVGERVKFRFRVQCREFGGRWYTSLILMDIVDSVRLNARGWNLGFK